MCHLSPEGGVEALEYGALPPDYLEERLLSIEPIAAIDLGELRSAARFRWPFHLEQIARQILRIAVSLDRPNVQMLAAA